MRLTKEDKILLRLLVEKESQALEQEGKTLPSSSASFLASPTSKASNLPFLKSQALAKRFLKQLLGKL